MFLCLMGGSVMRLTIDYLLTVQQDLLCWWNCYSAITDGFLVLWASTEEEGHLGFIWRAATLAAVSIGVFPQSLQDQRLINLLKVRSRPQFRLIFIPFRNRFGCSSDDAFASAISHTLYFPALLRSKVKNLIVKTTIPTLMQPSSV